MSSLFGTPPAQPAPSNLRPTTGSFPLKAVGSGLRLVALIGFIMPFATVSCGSQDLMTINGLQAAFGTPYNVMGQVGQADGDPWFVIALLLITGALVVGLLTANQTAGLLNDRQLNITGMVLGILASITFILAAASAGSQTSSQLGGQSSSAAGTILTIRWDFGFWLALLGILTSTVLAAISAFPQQFGLQMARPGIGARKQAAAGGTMSRGAPPGAVAIGTLSSDGTRFWNGSGWVPVEGSPGRGATPIGTLSPDGSRFWNGSQWEALE